MHKGLNFYHLIIVPKYRHKIFKFNDIRNYAKFLIENLNHKDFKIIDYSIEVDHIHFCLNIKPTISVSNIVI